MKVEVKKVDALKRELKFEIPKERVQKTLDDVYQEMGKVAKVKGYRPGKVPRNILEVHHGSYAQEEMMKKLIPEVYQEGISQEKLHPIVLPDIENVEFKEGKITFTAKIDIKPEVAIKNYKDIKVQRKSTEVTDEEIEKTLDFVKKGQGLKDDAVLDDNFAHGLGYPNLEEFKKFLKRQLEFDKDRQNRMDVENQVVEQLLKKAKLVTPQTLVDKQLEHRMEEWQKGMKQRGIKDEEINKKKEEARKDLRQAVEKDVRLYLIFDKIAQEEKIEIKQGDNLPVKVIEFLLKEAKWED